MPFKPTQKIRKDFDKKIKRAEAVLKSLPAEQRNILKQGLVAQLRWAEWEHFKEAEAVCPNGGAH